MLIKQFVIVLMSSTLLSCAGSDEVGDSDESSAGNGRSDCIFTPSIRGYTVLDESNLIIDVAGRRTYHLGLQRRAFGLRSTWAIAFDSPSSRVCAGFSSVVFQDHMNGDSIQIASITELSPADHEDLLIRFGKKEPDIERIPAPKDVKGAEVEELDPAAIDVSSGD